MNHYEILEVSSKASAEVIRAAYKSLMQRVHPDKSPADAAMTARATRIVQAYELLSDPIRRAEYDRDLIHRYSRGSERKEKTHAGNSDTDQ